MYPPQPDYAVTAPSMDMTMKRPSWEQIQIQISKMPPATVPNNNVQKRFPIKSLAELQQRKLEVISQLEKVVGKRAASVISNSASTQAKQDSSPPGDFDGKYFYNIFS